MNIKMIMDRVFFALSVPKCVCCNEKLDYGQKAFCRKCSIEFEDFKSRNCSKCAKILSKCDCSNSFLEGHFIKRVIKCYRYNNRGNRTPQNALIYSLKTDNRKDVLELCTKELYLAISNSIDNPSDYIFTNIPRRKKAIIEYGIDHSALLAESLAKHFGAKYINIMKSNAKKPQKSQETEQRLQNANFELTIEPNLQGRGVIIVDDIITSGASMSSAAALIRSLGCKNIVAAAIAIAYRDN